MSAPIAATLLFRRDDRFEPVWIEFDPADPLVVRFVFVCAPGTDGQRAPSWFVDRKLLADGGGYDKVHVTRTAETLTLEVGRRPKTALFEVHASTIDEVLREIDALVPLDSAITEKDIDKAVTTIFKRGRR